MTKQLLLFVSIIFIASTYSNAAMVTFSFDDGGVSQRDGISILSKYNMVGNLNIIAQSAGNPGRLTISDLLNAQALGWEIASHSYSHPNFLSLSYEQAAFELYYSKQYLASLGFDITNFVVPFSQWNVSLNSLALQYYNSVAVGYYGGWLNSYPVEDPYILSRYVVRDTTTVQDIKNVVDSATAENKWLILMLHSIGTAPTGSTDTYWWSKENLDEIASWIHSQDIAVVTQEQGISAQNVSLPSSVFLLLTGVGALQLIRKRNSTTTG
jgi:peptidoglycan/xylan/chitin deacetylase (PgdA/CDA1 family)